MQVKKPRTNWVLIATLCLAAQTQAQTPQSAPTRQELENTVQIMEQQVAMQQDRVDAVTEKLKATDAQIERRIDRVLGYLVTVTDSQDSGTKVTQAKADAFAGLKRQIDFYVRERDTRFAALYRQSTRLSKQDLADDVRRLNKRIEKRVDQALALIGSLPVERGMEKRQVYSNDGALYSTSNPAYRHQRQVLALGSQLRDQANQGLKASIDKLERSKLELQRALQYAQTEEGRKFVQEMMESNTELIAKRREQLADAATSANPAGRALGNRDADALVEMIRQEKLNNMKDNAEWTRLKNDRDVERARLHDCRVQLAYYQSQLEAAR